MPAPPAPAPDTHRPSLAPAVAEALAAGATVVTPNNRLARRLSAQHDAASQAAGLRAWPSAAVVPWNAWLATLWRDAVGAGNADDAPRLLTAAQAAHLWRRVVANDLAHAAPLTDAAGAAALAGEAWERLHAFGAGGESWRGWDSTAVGEDPAAFARWAESYRQALREAQAIDLAQVADRLLRAAPPWREIAPAAIALAGFVEPTAQQRRLFGGLAAAGVAVTQVDAVASAEQRVEVLACGTPREEIASALHWARARAEAAPDAAIGVVVLDLAARRDEVRALAEDILCPALQWPGQQAAARPYNLSLGTALADVPCIAAALDLLALTGGALAVDRAARLLRSRYLPGDDAAWLRRAAIEARWREAGRDEIDVAALTRTLAGAEAPLAQRWRAAYDASGGAGRAVPREWCQAWRRLLAGIGWPGERTPDSAEYQALGAWDDLLVTFATLDPVSGRLGRGDALAALRALAEETLFQPESAPAAIQIVGLLEAAGLPFDALWVAGLAADVWPPPARPNPLLPLAWQRERGVPRSSARRELDYARALMAQLARAAPQVVFSHPQRSDDHHCEASALLAAWASGPPPPVPAGTAPKMFADRPALAAIDDGQAPSVPAGTLLRGGAALIEAQSDCPFRAAATYRLGAAPWPRRGEGLSPLERGQLAHLALAAFWRRVGDRASLLALDARALDATVDDAVGEALRGTAVDERRWAGLPPALLPGERDRLRRLLQAWLDAGERGRQDFAVLEIESPLTLQFAGFALRFRQDRVDRLADGSVAIIDYKTGTTVALGKWFDARPQAPQLGVYLLARRAAYPEQAVGAVAYARLAPDALGWVGIAADADRLPPLSTAASATRGALADWAAVAAAWQASIGALAQEIATGVAVVRPRDTGSTCRRCGLQSLCRIDGLDADAMGETGDER